MLEVIYTTGTPYETEKLSLRDNTIIFPSTYKQIVKSEWIKAKRMSNFYFNVRKIKHICNLQKIKN